MFIFRFFLTYLNIFLGTMFFQSVFWQHILNLELKPFHWRLSGKREWKIKCWFQTYWSLCLNLLWRINSAKVISFVTYLPFGWHERIEIIILSHFCLQGQQFPFSDCLLRQFFFFNEKVVFVLNVDILLVSTEISLHTWWMIL